MKWSGKFKLLKVKPEKFLDDFMWFILDLAAKYFVRGMIGLGHVPAWTGQARASLTKAAAIYGLSISYSDAVEPNRKGKNVSTGTKQGNARRYRSKGSYIFEFTSHVMDLTSKNPEEYWLDNEYNPTGYDRVRQTPWHTIEEAGEKTEEYIQKEIVPLIKDFFGSDIFIKTYVTV